MSSSDTQSHSEHIKRQRWELLDHINTFTETPLIALSFVWLGLLVIDLTSGLSPLLQLVSTIIWVLFVLDFCIEFTIAPHKWGYLRRNWLTVVSLLLPALRMLRVVRAVRLLQAARATRSVTLIRLLTSLNRGMRAIGKTLGRHGIGYVVALTIIVTFAGAAGMAFFESSTALLESGYTTDAQAEGLNSYGEAVWWTAMIMTTMGSEYWPKTVEGRVLAWLLSLYAFTIFGYITASIATYFIGQNQGPDAENGVALDETHMAEITALRGELAALRAEIAALAPKNETTQVPADSTIEQ